MTRGTYKIPIKESSKFINMAGINNVHEIDDEKATSIQSKLLNN
jgi:hypothetical protein